LNYPKHVANWLRKQELLYVSEISEYFDSAALIGSLRLDEPDVLFAMLGRHPFPPAIALGDFLKPVSESL
jgi:hypothetical protein